MSVSRYCSFYKAQDGRWFMELAQEEHGEREDATTYGPFRDQEAAIEYLDENFANPGGWNVEDSGTLPVPTVSPNGEHVMRPGFARDRTLRRMVWR